MNFNNEQFDEQTFIYEKNILPQDSRFVSSFSFPKKLTPSTLDSFIDDLYKLDSVKKNVNHFNTKKNRELFSLVSNIYNLDNDLKDYIDSSISQLSSISSKNEALENISLLPYLSRAAKIISYDSKGVKSLENAVLSNASKKLSNDSSHTTVYFVGESIVLDKEAITYDSPKLKSYSPPLKTKLKILALGSAIAALSVYSFYTSPRKENIQSKINNFIESKKQNHYDVKPVAKYENQNISE